MKIPDFWPSSFGRPVLDDWEMPRIPRMAAMPMLMPSADSPARTLRWRAALIIMIR
jgi:hypothetical protein